MRGKLQALLQSLRSTVQGFMDEPSLALQGQLSMLQRCVHFWIVVYRAFVRNRCPVRASSLSYTTLLALVPLLAVVFGVTSSLLKSEGEHWIEQSIESLVASLTPPAVLDPANQPHWNEFIGPRPPAQPAGAAAPPTVAVEAANPAAVAPARPGQPATNGVAIASLVHDQRAVAARKEAAKWINEFVQNTRSGTLGVTGAILLIFVVISLVARIEETFNDIWGVAQGRTWFTRIILYWGAVTLGPLLLTAGLALLSSSQAEGIRQLIAHLGLLGALVFKVLPLAMMWLAFSLFYALMPATKVRWSAAAVGGFVGSLLWFLNNFFGFLYVSRVVGNSKIYGSLGLVPVFMVGLYFSWLILLFGAQVAYAFQNRAVYLQERLAEVVNQRGREFIALRLMTAIGQRFQSGERPATIPELSTALAVPSRLVQQVLQTLLLAKLVVEASGRDIGYAPARPLERIDCHQILQALRATNGQELATRDEPARAEVLGEFARIQEAERTAAVSVTLLALVNRAQARLELALPLDIRELKSATTVEPEAAGKGTPPSRAIAAGPAAVSQSLVTGEGSMNRLAPCTLQPLGEASVPASPLDPAPARQDARPTSPAEVPGLGTELDPAATPEEVRLPAASATPRRPAIPPDETPPLD